MPINEATVAKARLYPELLPDARVVSISAGFEASPAVLDLRRFKPKFLHLANLAVEQNSNVAVRTRADDLRDETNAGGLPDQEPAEWDLIGTEFLQYNLYASVNVTNFRTYFGLWVYEPTVAHKLKHNLKLTDEEAQIKEKLGISDSVEKGILPLPLSYMIEREYQVLGEKPYTVVTNVGTTESTVGYITARPGEFLVLTGISSAPGLVTDNVRIRVDRDDNPDYLELPTYPMALSRDIKCFVPALKELRIKLIAGGTVTGHAIRYTVRRVALTNLLRVRFGLVSKDEVPGDLWNKVKGGVL